MEGVRSELLKAVLDADADSDSNDDQEMPDTVAAEEEGATSPGQLEGPDVKKSTASDNKAFLASKLTFERHPETGEERCLDSEGNGVMMGWETSIMVETARLLCSSSSSSSSSTITEEDEGEEGFSVLNVGFGLGIVDEQLRKYGKPKRHVIIEPHPDVLEHARSKGWFERPGVQIYEGTWQDYMASFHAGEQRAEFDAVYVSSSLPSFACAVNHPLTTRSIV